MIEQKIPLFSSGNLLTQDMLESMKEHTIQAGILNYCGYSDGILCGCEITTSNEMITVGKGILLLEGEPFFVTRPVSVRYSQTNQYMILRAVIGDREASDNFAVRQLTVDLVTEEKLREKDIELCRFKLQSGAVLRTKYRDFEDMETEYDTVHFTYAKWSSMEKSSVSPVIFQMFLKEAMKYQMEEEIDQSFCLQLMNLNGRSMNRRALEFYIAKRLEQEYKELTNKEIYQGLKNVLVRIKKGRPEKTGNARKAQRILVD